MASEEKKTLRRWLGEFCPRRPQPQRLEADAYDAFERIREAAPMHAEKWLTNLFAAISSLENLPARCPVIEEAEELGFPARHLL